MFGLPYFVYMWVVVETGRTYVGYHKLENGEPLSDNYFQSSTDAKFKQEFSDASKTLKYKVFGYYDTEKDAKKFEGHMIRTLKKQGILMANKSNSLKEDWDKEKIDNMFSDIESKSNNGQYQIRPKEEIKDLGWYQPRLYEDTKHIKNIRTRMNDAIKEGRDPLQKSKPIIVGKIDGDHKGISGYHTGEAFLKKDCKAAEYKRIDVDLTGWNILEIIKLSSLFNDTDEERKPMRVEDYAKQLVTLYIETGSEPDSDVAERYLSDYKTLHTQTRKAAINRAQEEVNTKKQEAKYNRKWKYYETKDKNIVIDKHTKDGVKVIVMGSGRDPWNNLLPQMTNESGKKYLDNIHTYEVYFHHTSSDKMKKFRSEKGPRFQCMIDLLFSQCDFTVEYHELPNWQSDTKNSNGK